MKFLRAFRGANSARQLPDRLEFETKKYPLLFSAEGIVFYPSTTFSSTGLWSENSKPASRVFTVFSRLNDQLRDKVQELAARRAQRKF